MSGISASPHSFRPLQAQQRSVNGRRGPFSISIVHTLSPQNNLRSSDLKLKNVTGLRKRLVRRLIIQCSSSGRPGGPSSGESENKGILDAFFLGKALAEALNERLESAVGELISTVGRLQAEQQKQVQDFQEEVLERAKSAKEKAAREALEAQGLIPKSSTEVKVATNDEIPPISPASDVSSPPVSTTFSSPSTTTINGDPIEE